MCPLVYQFMVMTGTMMAIGLVMLAMALFGEKESY